VKDLEAFPIVGVAEDRELLDVTKNGPDMRGKTFGPPISEMMRAAARAPGAKATMTQKVTVECTIEVAERKEIPLSAWTLLHL
jgi:hypothetical protein